MARLHITDLLSPDQEEQLSALRTLKNEIVGHDQKKEKWVENGIIEPVVQILESSRSCPSINVKESSRGRMPASRPLTGEESVRLQALQVLSSLANGGFAFLAPILAAGALPAILSNIPPAENPPRVVVAALRATVNIAEASTLAPPTSTTDIGDLALIAFVPVLLDAFRDILTSTAANHAVQTQKNLAAKLIGLLCRDERSRVDLTNHGILDALATNLAAVVVARGFVVPGAEAIAQSEGVLDLIPGPAAPNTDVTAILQALYAIIGDSRWRASVLVCAPALVAVFPHAGSPRRSKDMKACVNSLEVAGLSSIASKDLGALDCFLPVVPQYQAKGTTMPSYPLVGSPPPKDYLAFSKAPSTKYFASSSSLSTAQTDSGGANAEGAVEETESPLIPWLLYTVRSTMGMERVMAASVLTSLHRAGLANKSREAYMGYLIVPILLQTLEDIGVTCCAASQANFVDAKTGKRSIIERCLAILARLIVDSEFLQKCAFECGGVKIVSAYLKSAYEPLASKSSKAWSPSAGRENTGERGLGLPTSRLGPGGQLPLQVHRTRVRENALKAIAGLAASKDDYRKALVEQDLVPFIVESLSPNPSNPKNKDRSKSPKRVTADGGEYDAAYGVNPITVIVAACHALRMLARSVSILRTTLEDNAVATPAFRLLRHADIDIQIAASALMCNLVTDVAPMREYLNGVGVMRILCEQTRSQNPALRLNALWALKNWVNGVGMDAKKECVEELSAGWLVHLIRDDTEDDALYERTTRFKKQAANDMDEDVEMAQAGEEGSASGSALPDTSTLPPSDEQGRTPRLRQGERKIAELRDTELSLTRKVRDDDLAVQEQGLQFVRNLIGPASSATDSARDHADMIDYLFNILGQDRFFELLDSKLQPKHLHPFGRRYSISREPRVLYPQARIVSAVVYILVHMAASVPRHRQVLISQTKLLQDLAKQFHSKDKDVRVALCHLMTNLTWRDDPDDEDSSRQRAGELKNLGLLTKLETLESDDEELDVRERAKAAIWQISQPRREF
ncbi:armadillo repeat protein [Diaporthe helianthi]|uniref:Armadillo repeat protein n=1 Tax=Diaporthe helianthi TaxID=158607 RepID=A0A2P5HQ28_DIAHE|nr:armadillo repeat protein [Diaporthe helianthi]